jgi:hypothetical protein
MEDCWECQCVLATATVQGACGSREFSCGREGFRRFSTTLTCMQLSLQPVATSIAIYLTDTHNIAKHSAQVCSVLASHCKSKHVRPCTGETDKQGNTNMAHTVCVRRAYTGIVILYRYSVYRYHTGIIGKKRYLRYILAFFYTAGTV